MMLMSGCATEEVTPTAALESSASRGNGRQAAAGLAAPTLTAAPPTAGPDSDDGMVEAWGAASDMPLSRESIGAGIIPLDIEREMWQSFAAVRRQRTLRLIRAAASLVRCRSCMLIPCLFSSEAAKPMMSNFTLRLLPCVWLGCGDEKNTWNESWHVARADCTRGGAAGMEEARGAEAQQYCCCCDGSRAGRCRVGAGNASSRRAAAASRGCTLTGPTVAGSQGAIHGCVSCHAQ